MITRRTRKAGIIFETLLILVSLGLLYEAFMTGTAEYKFINAGRTIEGTVSAINTANLGFYVQFPAASGGKIVFEQYGPAFGYSMGDEVPVIYDENNPEIAVVNSFSAVWIKTAALALAGFFFLITGLRMRAARSL